MKKFLIPILIVLVVTITGCGGSTQATSNQQPTQVKQESMAQFSTDLAKFMKASAVKEGAPADDISISANCKPNQGEYGTRCWINIKELTTGSVDKATAENVRRRGDKFVWDHES